jgi:NAD(P)H-flavin reductase
MIATAALPGVMVPWTARIRRVIDETHDTFTLVLDPGATRRAPFRPGQFHMLWAPGAGESAISISGDPAENGTIVHTIREVGTVTRALRRMKKGACLGVRGPFGRPWPVDRAAGLDVVIVTGGIGLAPLRPVLYEIASHRKDFGRVSLLYGCRRPEEILFRPQLEAWRAESAIDVAITVDRAAGGWPGNVGVVTSLVPRASFDPHNALAFVCGPEIMMRFSAMELMRRGMPASRIVVSLERNMKCGCGLCGHCQLGPTLVCRDGPVYEYDRVRGLLEMREV